MYKIKVIYVNSVYILGIVLIISNRTSLLYVPFWGSSEVWFMIHWYEPKLNSSGTFYVDQKH
jgi:hypothetical protein